MGAGACGVGLEVVGTEQRAVFFGHQRVQWLLQPQLARLIDVQRGVEGVGFAGLDDGLEGRPETLEVVGRHGADVDHGGSCNG